MRAFGVLTRAAVLWWRHWPVLLAVSLLGMAGRNASIWAAVDLSKHHHDLGIGVLMFAPLSAVAAIVVMLHVLRHSLPALSLANDAIAPDDPATRRERRLLDVIGSVLVPFLAVYAAWGYLHADAQQFVNSAVADEFFNNALALEGVTHYDVNRTVVATGWAAAAVVVVALALRYGIGRAEGRTRWRGLGFVGAYVEVFWLVTIAALFATYKDDVESWVEGRRGWSIAAGWWQSFVDALGPVGPSVDAVGTWVVDVLGSAETVVLLPLAWLAVGVVVYGHKLAAPPAPDWPERVPGLRRLPPTGRRWTVKATEDLGDRFFALAGGIRQLIAGGLVPMLMFLVVFLATRRLEDGLDLLGRRLVGPQDLDTWITIDPLMTAVAHAITMTVTIVLLAAVVDQVLSRSFAPAEEPSVVGVDREVVGHRPPEVDLRDPDTVGEQHDG